MGSNIRHQVISGVKWNALGQFGSQGILFVVSILLARILLPEEFGLIGMLIIFTSVSTVFIGSGLGAALIKKKNCTNADYSTVFFYNIAVSLLFFAAMFISAPYIAAFYNEPQLTNIARIVAFLFIINAFGMVQITILQKELHFKAINLIQMAAIIVSAIVAVYMAYNDYGVYSLVWQQITHALVSNVLYWIGSAWKPNFVFSRSSFKELFGFGSRLLLSGLLDQIYVSVDSLLIGKIFNAEQLGYYTRAKSTRDMPVANSTGILSKIVFPIFARIDDDNELRHRHLQLLGLTFFIIMPVMTGMLVVAEPLVIVLFTEKWLPSVWMLQILCAVGFSYPLSVILVQTILAKGRSDVFLKLDVLKKIIGFTAMIIGLYFGLIPFVIGISIANVLGLLVNILFVSGLLSLNIKAYVRLLMPVFAICVVMGLLVYGTGALLNITVVWKLIIQTFSGIIVFFGLSYVFKVKELFYFWELITDKIKRIRNHEA